MPIPSDEGPIDRFVDRLPETRLFKFLASWILVPLWARLTPVKPLPGGPHPSFQRGDNVQCMMNLIMPLKDKSPVGRAQAALAIAQNKDAIFAGLNNVGTVHFARFVIVGDNICMFSVYDGDFTNYIRDFIATIGSVFNAVVGLVEGGEKVTPLREECRGIHPMGARARPVPGAGHRHRFSARPGSPERRQGRIARQ